MRRFRLGFTLVSLLASSCASLNTPRQPAALPVHYHNADYGFTFCLPASWQGYSVLTQQWQEAQGGPEHGSLLLLRHPRWAPGDPYQDIPILVFTRNQWESDKQGRITIGAGGLEEEIGHNSTYVFGISSRLNADDSVHGWRETTKAVA